MATLALAQGCGGDDEPEAPVQEGAGTSDLDTAGSPAAATTTTTSAPPSGQAQQAEDEQIPLVDERTQARIEEELRKGALPVSQAIEACGVEDGPRPDLGKCVARRSTREAGRLKQELLRLLKQ